MKRQSNKKSEPGAAKTLKRLRELCLSLPGTSERGSWGHPNFVAGKKTFVTFEFIGQRPSIAFRMDPLDVKGMGRDERFFDTPYGRGQWLSLWADRKLNWDFVTELVIRSYRLVAPLTLPQGQTTESGVCVGEWDFSGETTGERAKDVISMLEGGDRRSIGKVNEVVRTVIQEPKRFRALVDGLLSDDEVVRMRCADAIEKIAHVRPHWLKPHTNFFLEQAAGHSQQEVCWHMAQIMPLLPLTPVQRTQAIQVLTYYLESASGIVRVSAMQALTALSYHDSQLEKKIIPLVKTMMKNGTPAVRARGKTLLSQLEASRKK